jgi:hypothetical protein
MTPSALVGGYWCLGRNMQAAGSSNLLDTIYQTTQHHNTVWKPPTLNQVLQWQCTYCAIITRKYSLLCNGSIMKVSMEANQYNAVTEWYNQMCVTSSEWNYLRKDPIQAGSNFFNQPICNLQPATCSLQTFKLKFICMFCIMSINICTKGNKWLSLQILTNPTLVTPMKKNADYGRQTYSGKCRMAVQLPPFWAEWPAMWFAQAEAQFTLAGISSEKTKFYYVISQLDHRYAAEVEDIIVSPLEQDPYTILKTV